METAILMLLQAAAQAPDIKLNAHIRARQVTIEKKGDARLTVWTDPDAGGNLVDVQAPKANGRKTLRNVEVNVRAEARIADPREAPQIDFPQINLEQSETPQPE